MTPEMWFTLGVACIPVVGGWLAWGRGIDKRLAMMEAGFEKIDKLVTVLLEDRLGRPYHPHP